MRRHIAVAVGRHSLHMQNTTSFDLVHSKWVNFHFMIQFNSNQSIWLFKIKQIRSGIHISTCSIHHLHFTPLHWPLHITSNLNQSESDRWNNDLKNSWKSCLPRYFYIPNQRPPRRPVRIVGIIHRSYGLYHLITVDDVIYVVPNNPRRCFPKKDFRSIYAYSTESTWPLWRWRHSHSARFFRMTQISIPASLKTIHLLFISFMIFFWCKQ